jgi:hypothetical protein
MPRRLVAAPIVALLSTAVPASAGVPFVTDDPDTPDKGHFEINVAHQYTLTRDEQSANLPSVEVNYGLTSNLELHIFVPLAFNHPRGGGSVAGLGDVELGVKYRFIDEDDDGWRPAIAFAPAIQVPTGNANRALGSGQTQAFLPIWMSKDIGKFTVFGGGGYQINPGPENRNYWLAGVGVTYEINPQWTVGAEVFHSTVDVSEGFSSTGFNLGVIYNIDDNHHLMMSAGRGLVNATQNNQFSAFLGYQLTF